MQGTPGGQHHIPHSISWGGHCEKTSLASREMAKNKILKFTMFVIVKQQDEKENIVVDTSINDNLPLSEMSTWLARQVLLYP